VINIKLNKIPTGIPTLDTIIKGGFPSGSLVLLIGDVGAGNLEFAYTSAVMLSILKNNPQKFKTVREQALLAEDENLKLPKNICYISFTHSKDDLMTELGHAFSPEFAAALSGNMCFKCLSQSSIFPAENAQDWLSIKTMRGLDDERELVKELISVLDDRASNNVVIIDSLTSLFRACNKFMDWNDSISFLEYLQQRAKKWDGLVYLLMGRGILESKKEEEIMDVADGVLVFEWFQEGFSRQQAMYMKKFRGVMPHVARDYIVKFDTMVTDSEGFVVTNVKRISGIK